MHYVRNGRVFPDMKLSGNRAPDPLVVTGQYGYAPERVRDLTRRVPIAITAK